jgi:ribosome maturation protein Sdo1
MSTKTAQPATNERIVRLLEEVKVELAEAKRRDEQLARALTRLLERK